MIPKLVSDLHAIASKPNVSPGTLLIVTRRTCRILLSLRDSIWRERKEFLRTAIKAGRDLPFSALDIEMLQDLAVTITSTPGWWSSAVFCPLMVAVWRSASALSDCATSSV